MYFRSAVRIFRIVAFRENGRPSQTSATAISTTLTTTTSMDIHNGAYAMAATRVVTTTARAPAARRARDVPDCGDYFPFAAFCCCPPSKRTRTRRKTQHVPTSLYSKLAMESVRVFAVSCISLAPGASVYIVFSLCFSALRPAHRSVDW